MNVLIICINAMSPVDRTLNSLWEALASLEACRFSRSFINYFKHLRYENKVDMLEISVNNRLLLCQQNSIIWEPFTTSQLGHELFKNLVYFFVFPETWIWYHIIIYYLQFIYMYQNT